MATWLKFNQSYRPLQIYTRQNGVTAVPFKRLCAQHRTLTDLKNQTLLEDTAITQTKCRVDPSQDDQVISVTRKNADRQTAFRLYLDTIYILANVHAGKYNR